MDEANAYRRYHFSGLHRGNKYWFLGSTIFFLLAASVYLIFTPVTYKVATRIVVKSNQEPGQIIKDVKSKELLQKVINQLPLKVAYFKKEKSKDVNISKDALPVQFVLSENTHVNSSAELKIFVVNNQQYKILKDKVFMYFLFDEPVDFYSFAKFKIVKGSGFKINAGPSIIRVYSDRQLLQQYGDNLDAKLVGGTHKSIELSLTGSSLKNGQIFLDKLVKVYNESNHVGSSSNNVPEINPAYIEKISDDLAVLKAKTEEFKKQQSVIVNGKNGNPDKELKGKGNTQLLNVLSAIEPYAKRSANQFVLIPYGDEVKDSGLQTLINQFNSIQLERQHVIQQSKADNSEIVVLNTQILTLKQQIIEKITVNKNELSGNQRSSSTTIAAISDSILKITKLLNSKQQEYNTLLKAQAGKIEAAPAKPSEAVIEKSDENVITYPKSGYVYLFAFLIGVVLPLIIPYFRIWMHLRQHNKLIINDVNN